MDKEEDEEEKSDFSFFSFHSSFDNTTTETEEEADSANVSCKTFIKTTINPWERGKTNNLLYVHMGWHLDKEENKEEKSGFSSPSFNSSFDDAIAETGRGAETATVVS